MKEKYVLNIKHIKMKEDTKTERSKYKILRLCSVEIHNVYRI